MCVCVCVLCVCVCECVCLTFINMVQYLLYRRNIPEYVGHSYRLHESHHEADVVSNAQKYPRNLKKKLTLARINSYVSSIIITMTVAIIIYSMYMNKCVHVHVAVSF